MINTCSTCEAWQGKPRSKGHKPLGTCRRHAPSPHGWPLTADDDWCCAYLERPDAKHLTSPNPSPIVDEKVRAATDGVDRVLRDKLVENILHLIKAGVGFYVPVVDQDGVVRLGLRKETHGN